MSLQDTSSDVKEKELSKGSSTSSLTDEYDVAFEKKTMYICFFMMSMGGLIKHNF